jgi:uncharacterized lipoprotein YmbA
VKLAPANTALPLCLLLLAACAGMPDHFYTLNTLPVTAATPPAAPTTAVHLNVTVPSLVDRSEMVLSTSKSGVAILDHERWAAPLSDQVAQTLARDIERQRGDLMVGDRRFDRPAPPPVSLRVDIVRLTAQRAGAASMEAHWRIIDAGAGADRLGSGSFAAAVNGGDYAAVAQAYSQLLRDLAEKLAADIARR